MDALVDYLAMGGYWQFVWPAYGIAAVVLVALLMGTLRAVRTNEAAVAALDRERPRRRRSARDGGLE